MSSPFAVTHRGDEVFGLAPSELWAELEDVERFEEWWSWLRDLTLEPPRLATGSVLTFTIETPLPYRMRCRVEMIDVAAGERIVTRVSGDLQGTASLELHPVSEDATRIELEWELEPTQKPMRLLLRVARPLILKTKDWAVDLALSSFRRNVEGN